ncbi:MAG: GNAT family N-acetyltransferase [Anaerolineales bacterium]|nr:GNAT family N-acetyltransferase [Anaerolineales bacterium]
MRQIRELKSSDNEMMMTIMANAYPGISLVTEADRDRFLQRIEQMMAEPSVKNWGLFVDDALLGMMRLFDFMMTLHETPVLVGGVGSVAVDLAHKKQKVARDMILFFLRHYREKGAALTALYPFRPDFYRQMGFGHGTKMNQYRVNPADLPQGSRHNVRVLDGSHRQELADCYRRIMQASNGIMAQFDYELESIFTSQNMQRYGYWADGQLRGYLLFTFDPIPNGNFLRNNIAVRTLMYEDAEALRGLLGFLRVQADQIEKVVINTQEEAFHLLLHDPRNGSQNLIPSGYHETNTQGVGIMYRVIDVPRLFDLLANHNFGSQTVTVQLDLTDSFWPMCAGSWVLVAENGRITLNPSATPNVAIKLDIAEFSSLITGATTFRQLLAYGLAEISDTTYADAVHTLFYTPSKPVCHTAF